LVRSPRRLDVKKTEPINTPEAFRSTVQAPKIDILPLLRDPKGDRHPGWCTYTDEHAGAPELELLCGGVNHKTPRAGAIWRQGHLLHFGFEPSPERMSEVGQALLVNAICYIARFTEDRPIVRTPCGFLQDHWITGRSVLERLVAHGERDPKTYVPFYVGKNAQKELEGKSRREVGEWFRRHRDYLRADKEGKLDIDGDLQSLHVAADRPEFFEKMFVLLADAGRQETARRVLKRYVPDGPRFDASVQQWRAWWKENQPYAFFTDRGGYRWMIDPLAKKRAIPTAKLRGSARATLPGVKSRSTR
jgi:hypothetical protein